MKFFSKLLRDFKKLFLPLQRIPIVNTKHGDNLQNVNRKITQFS